MFWPLFLAGSERLRNNRRMTDAPHNQHGNPPERSRPHRNNRAQPFPARPSRASRTRASDHRANEYRVVLCCWVPQSPSGVVGGRRWLAAKDVNEANEEQRLGEGKRVPERVGAFYCCPQLLDGSIRVTSTSRRQSARCRRGSISTAPGSLLIRKPTRITRSVAEPPPASRVR